MSTSRTAERRGQLLACGAFAALACAPSAARAPTLDGVIEAHEWQGARVVTLGPAGAARGYSVRRPGALYLGVDDHDRGIGTVLVALGARVYVLHASAALATAIYERDADGSYRLVRGFAYVCRDPSVAPAALACRDQFLRDEHWVANVEPHGGKNREYRFAGPFAAAAARFVVVAYVFPDEVRAWPENTRDDAVNVELLKGETPEQLRFATERWQPLP
jgi:hypothetical protein